MINRIVLAVDGSDHSERAAATAGELSAAFDSPVDVINVVPSSNSVVSGAMHEYAEIEQVMITQRDLLKAAGNEIVAEAARIVGLAGGHIEEVEVAIGSPAAEIVAYSDTKGADTIVMGRRGLGNLKGLLMGSTSHRVGQLSGKTLITAE